MPSTMGGAKKEETRSVGGGGQSRSHVECVVKRGHEYGEVELSKGSTQSRSSSQCKGSDRRAWPGIEQPEGHVSRKAGDICMAL